MPGRRIGHRRRQGHDPRVTLFFDPRQTNGRSGRWQREFRFGRCWRDANSKDRLPGRRLNGRGRKRSTDKLAPLFARVIVQHDGGRQADHGQHQRVQGVDRPQVQRCAAGARDGIAGPEFQHQRRPNVVTAGPNPASGGGRSFKHGRTCLSDAARKSSGKRQRVTRSAACSGQIDSQLDCPSLRQRVAETLRHCGESSTRMAARHGQNRSRFPVVPVGAPPCAADRRRVG